VLKKNAGKILFTLTTFELANSPILDKILMTRPSRNSLVLKPLVVDDEEIVHQIIPGNTLPLYQKFQILSEKTKPLKSTPKQSCLLPVRIL